MRNLLIASTATFLTLAAAACGDDSSPPASDAAVNIDAPEGAPDAAGAADAAAPDAVPADAAPLDPSLCPMTYGPSMVIDTFVMANSETGAFDLDGDGTPDNQLAPVAGLANMDFSADIMSGAFRVVSELRMLDDATMMNDADVPVFVASAVDTDTPADPGDDFSHMESFYFDQSAVNPADCSPRALVPGTLTGGTLSAAGDTLPLMIPGFGVLPIGEPRVEAQIAPDTAGFLAMSGGRLGGAFPTCPLQMSMGSLGNNNLHALTGFLGIQPDIDLDGDGVESIQADALGIISCTDGDGTVIPGETCGCDPRIVDGFSVYINFSGVGAVLTGPAPAP